MEAVSFVKLTEEIVLFSVSEWFIDVSMNVIRVTLIIHKVNMFNKNNLLKLNLISWHGKRKGTFKNVIQVEIIGNLHGSKSDLNNVF